MSQFRAKFMAGVLIGTLALGMALDANAKRLGGSRSIGKQSSGVTQRQQAPAQQSPNQTPAQQQPAQQAAPAGAAAGAGAAAAAAPKRNWGAMLGGIAAGLGIGALLSHFGLGGAAMGFLSNLILIALVAFVAIWLIRKFRGGASRPQQPAYAGAGAGNGLGGGSNEPVLRQQVPVGAPNPVMPAPGASAEPSSAPVMAGAAAGAVAAQPWGVPADFDTAAFLRNAKIYYVRLQAAWDAGNLEDIREFTTPEMFAEIRMDLSERGTEVNKTDVVTLEAELLGIEDSPAQHLASVRFSGMIREKAGDSAQPFAEVWNLAKPATGSGGWLLAGIQQVS
jgi:predicted lipid-binding transport protein (Tim44 family)